MRFARLLAVAAMSALAWQWQTGAQEPVPQYRVPSLTDLSGAPGLSLALKKLSTTGTIAYLTAHPDDEHNAVLALYARHVGARVALVTATRGDGGQNEIGTEIFDALGVLRTEELLAAHRFDGAEQYFTRAVDFGFSFSQQETFEKWGREEIVGDFVRHIRTLRPDVIVSLSPEGTGGGQHHQASAVLATEAFRAAGDATKFPEQLRDGLRPWQPVKLYRPFGGFGGRGGRGGPPPTPSDGTYATLDTTVYQPSLGCTIAEVGGIASGMHMCQGRVPMVPPPGPSYARYRLFETTLPNGPFRSESSLFEGIDVSLAGLARFASSQPPQALTGALATISARIDGATRAFQNGGPVATLPDLAAALTATRDLLAKLGGMGLGDVASSEIEFRLRLKEKQIEDAMLLAQGVRIEATANDGLIVAGQPLSVSIAIGNRGDADLGVTNVTLLGFDGFSSCPAARAAAGTAYQCDASVTIPPTAQLTDVYWQRPENGGRATFDADAPFGLPFRPSPFRARIELDVAGTRVTHELPIQYRYEGAGLVGEKRMELNVVPSLAVSVSPPIVVVPKRGGAAVAASAGRELRVTVINGGKGAAAATVRLKAPSGWRVFPASAALSFTREDESVTTRFMVTPPANAAAGDQEISAEVVSTAVAGASYNVGYQTIEYPHIQRRQKIVPAVALLKVLDVTLPSNLTVGYIMGVGDRVPDGLQQLGARVTMIDRDELAWGDLSRYDAIVTGVRAYEERTDLRANNNRLLQYVQNGGTAIIQYNKMEFNEAQYGPFPAIVSTDRITDENAPVKILQPEHPAFNTPNKLNDRDWEGWVQERGTYFLGKRDPRYSDLIEMEDPFEFNKGPKRGALVEARYGKGRWLYVGLGLWRQLPSGTDGAYRLFANLISLGRPVPKPRPVAVER